MRPTFILILADDISCSRSLSLSNEFKRSDRLLLIPLVSGCNLINDRLLNNEVKRGELNALSL